MENVPPLEKDLSLSRIWEFEIKRVGKKLQFLKNMGRKPNLKVGVVGLNYPLNPWSTDVFPTRN